MKSWILGVLLLPFCVAVASADLDKPFQKSEKGKLFGCHFGKTNYTEGQLSSIFQIDGDYIHVYKNWSKEGAPFGVIYTTKKICRLRD